MSRAILARRIALPLGAVALLLQFALAAYALNHERRTLFQQLDARAKRLANTCLAVGLTGTQFDEENMARWLGTTLLEQDDVLFCEVSIPEGQTLFRGGTLEKPASRRYAFALPKPTRPAPNGATEYQGAASTTETSSGTLYLALSTATVEQALTEARGALIMGTLAGTAVILLFAVLIVRHTVGNAVAHLLRNARTASVPCLVRTPSSRTADPLEQLAETFDAMTTQIQEMVAREEELTAQVLSERSQCEPVARQ